MPNGLMSLLAVTAVFLAVAVAGVVLQKGRVHWGWLAGAVLLIAIHDALLTGAWGLLPLPGIGDRWNWSGKIAAAVAMLAVSALPALGLRRSGLTLAQSREGLTGALIACGLLVAVFLGLAVAFPGEGGDAETFAFQLTMPGIEEEIFYRGVLLLMLNEAFGRPVVVLGAPMGWAAVLTSLAFGLDHALGYGAEGFSFEPLALALTGGPALILVWLREKTGSILLPVLMHNFANVAPMLL
ncbi:MAG: CPBP family intramembrane glutamic endopeptidase [Pseudomonadota bacterium]|nr:CPBP family intramembrane glutamic endopeptidase [Pseudomonadota bacterium]